MGRAPRGQRVYRELGVLLLAVERLAVCAQVGGQLRDRHLLHHRVLRVDEVGEDNGVAVRWLPDILAEQTAAVAQARLGKVQVVEMSEASVKDEVASNGRLALRRVKPIWLAEHAVEAAAVPHDRRVEGAAGMPRCHVAVSCHRHLALGACVGPAIGTRQSWQMHARAAAKPIRCRQARVGGR
eukprot:104177-Pleurochrysis_carterae.AAC.1